MKNARSLGYFLVLAPPVILAWSTFAGRHWATFLAFIVASPVTRLLVGVHKPNESDHSEAFVRALCILPALYGITLMFLLPAAFAAFGQGGQQRSGLGVIGFGLSLWTTLVFGTFPAHELLHRRDKVSIRFGALISGMCGYPIQGLEHAVHHDSRASAEADEAARKEESVWSFAFRRVPRAFKNALDRNAAMRTTGEWRGASPLACGAAGSLLAVVAAWLLAGLPGLAIYVFAGVGVVIAMQIMTFVQHWALGSTGAADELAWEDDCSMQAWLTLNNSFHAAHHRQQHVPFFYLRLAEGAPRQPGCYVVMLSVSIIPSVWRRLMCPVLEAFLENRAMVCRPGRRAICIRPSPGS